MTDENTKLNLKMSSSPDRNSFQKQSYIDRKKSEGKEPDPAYLDFFDSISIRKDDRISDPEWQTDNLEYDLRTTDWVLEKVRNSDTYAQNLYAAMCNNGFIKNDVWPILLGKEWGCSWRSAGGIIADMRETGDYIDWYCSGIGEGLGNGDLNGDKKYVNEGCITEEIKNDLIKLGWTVAPGGDNEKF